MINDDVKKQAGGDGSSNTQANEITIHNGITYRDAKEIALDVYKANFLELQKSAAHIAKQRAEEITDAFLNKLQENNAEAISQMNEPGMQMALFEAQKSYAKSGDEELESLLVDILVERAETTERNLKQITLDEALQIAPKLTEEHLAVLTLNFFISKSTQLEINNYDSFKEKTLGTLKTLSKQISENRSSISYLKYTGCITPLTNTKFKSIEELIRNSYQGLFLKGFSLEELQEITVTTEIRPKWLCQCQHNKSKQQLSYMTQKFMQQSLLGPVDKVGSQIA